MDLTPFLSSLEGTTLDQVLLSVAISGKVAIAMKGRFLLRSVCESFQDRTRIGCAVTDEPTCLAYLAQEPYELLICTDYLESGSGFELARKARESQPALKVVVLAPVGGAWIGTVAELPAGLAPRVLLATALGTERLLLPTSGELLPRIC